jgi:hypothetical protein
LDIRGAPLPEHDFTPLLDQIFGDLHYAGIDAIELVEVIMRHDDAVPRLRALSQKHNLPVIGMSYYADMWNREQHAEIRKHRC